MMNKIIVMGYAIGLGSFFSERIFPCFKEHRGVIYKDIHDILCEVTSYSLTSRSEGLVKSSATYAGVTHDQLVSWVHAVEGACLNTRRFSFVVRTLFRRPDLLRRCIISIDYIRSCLGIDAEIIISSDIDPEIVAAKVQDLSDYFPFLSFVTADGRSERGYSRVRNLVAGVKRSAGESVCIIDDDDFYTPHAVMFFREACNFSRENLIIFDTQIIEEKWSHAGVKAHCEIVAYHQLYPSGRWGDTLRGTNSIPLCGIIHPGNFVRQVAESYKFSFDYSEDFLFHLCCFSHPHRPPVKPMSGIGAYQSHRPGHDNVSTVEDRSRWVLDTGNGLYQLLFEHGRNFDSISGPEILADWSESTQRLASLKAERTQAYQAAEQATASLAAFIDGVTNHE